MLHAASLQSLPGIRHAFFTRRGGVSGGVYESLNGGVGSRDTVANVAENRALMAKGVGVDPENFLTAHQIHSPDVVTVEKPWTPDARPRADALVTCVPGIAVGVSTADCGPILFADATARVVGATHAGWRGAFTGVIEATIAAMEKLGADRASIVAAAGPMIRQPNYEVGPEFVERFTADSAGNRRFFTPSAKDGHAMFDLAGYIAARLSAAGIRQIEDVGRCTYADAESFYSYRRSVHRNESDYGRHINAIALSE